MTVIVEENSDSCKTDRYVISDEMEELHLLIISENSLYLLFFFATSSRWQNRKLNLRRKRSNSHGNNYLGSSHVQLFRGVEVEPGAFHSTKNSCLIFYKFP